ncbi:MAG: hypothetical protein K0Q79_2438 [Flavipsychrobacter sp.]|jgi:hypothetical protein|nr:hypothetical protein [Flavipsychrobacter sp.]
MARYIALLFFSLLFMTGNSYGHAKHSFPQPEPKHNTVSFSPVSSIHQTVQRSKPFSKLSKIYIKTRFKNSEVRFDACVFCFTIPVEDVYATIKKQEELHFLYKEYHRVISLRGPPSLS